MRKAIEIIIILTILAVVAVCIVSLGEDVIKKTFGIAGEPNEAWLQAAADSLLLVDEPNEPNSTYFNKRGLSEVIEIDYGDTLEFRTHGSWWGFGWLEYSADGEHNWVEYKLPSIKVGKNYSGTSGHIESRNNQNIEFSGYCSGDLDIIPGHYRINMEWFWEGRCDYYWGKRNRVAEPDDESGELVFEINEPNRPNDIEFTDNHFVVDGNNSALTVDIGDYMPSSVTFFIGQEQMATFLVKGNTVVCDVTKEKFMERLQECLYACMVYEDPNSPVVIEWAEPKAIQLNNTELHIRLGHDEPVWKIVLDEAEERIEALEQRIKALEEPEKQKQELVTLEEYEKSRLKCEIITETLCGIACPECGAELMENLGFIYTTSPPMTGIYCPKCEWSGLKH